MISTLGGLGAIASSLYYFPKGDFFVGVMLVSLFVLSDLFDGAVARASNQGESKWGALLDSTLDRISDAAILIGGLLFFLESSDPLVILFVIAAFASFMVSYIKARGGEVGKIAEKDCSKLSADTSTPKSAAICL